ncbi:MAG: 2,3-bisphosphoglycerate-independent phosphoglycerate mutase [Patescibacteria group bacterium]
MRPKPVVLTILDGWGIANDSVGNAIAQAKTPNFDKYCKEYFCATLQSSGEAVGLPFGEMGNSEVGHLNIGAGKIVYQNLPRINKAITDQSFFNNPMFIKACENSIKNKSNLHLMGLLSKGGVHASIDHIYALLELAKKEKVKNVYIHAFLDGRDMDYNSGLGLLEELQKKIDEIGIGEISTVMGRFWAMDRDNRWQRTEKAYIALTQGKAYKESSDILKTIQESYDKKEYDEEMKPIIVKNSKGQVKDKDSVIFVNFRPDRARQLTKAFVLPGFEKFDRGEYLQNIYFVTMVQYDKSLPLEIAFLPEFVEEPLGKVIADNDLKQLHVAETEKYAHVTYFINGGTEIKFNGEEDILINSPKVENYDQKPEMSAIEIKNTVIKKINEEVYDLIIINFANSDMVGHTGNMKAAINAVETVDKCLGEISTAVLEKNGVMVVTSDHGNAEELINPNSGEIIKEHSTNPVPLMVLGKNFQNMDPSEGEVDLGVLTPSGVLADIAPTVLKIMGVEKPEEMTGQSLV